MCDAPCLLTAVGKRVKMAVKRGFQLSGDQIECQQWGKTYFGTAAGPVIHDSPLPGGPIQLR
jgi:hypothetical protein